ncbi:MAG TPA: serine/threonine-protein kinase [Rubrobacter sp.]|nr:serine/threonine-protein kinase [Rubrobacter sp.]
MIRFADRFVLEHELGSGGMARVFLGRDEVLDRPVAVKLLNPVHGGTDIGDRFEREGRTAARLAHPNIVQVYDAGEAEFDGRETSYIVMEYVPGGDLKGLIDRRGRLPGPELARLGEEVCAGLAQAHERGVIHRDIKPHNILLDENGHAKVTDFGIARALDTTQATRTGFFLGTALYSSPEQLQGQKVTPKSDIYSLGTTLYQAAAGEPPFAGQTPIEIASQHVSKSPTPPRSRGAEVNGNLEALILSCLGKDPEDRPTAEEVRSRLDAEIRTAAATQAQPEAPVATAASVGAAQAPAAPSPPPPSGRSGGDGGRPKRRGGLLAALALLAVLVVIGALAAPNLLGRGGDQIAGANNAGQNNAQGGNARPSGGGSGGDQSPGGGQQQGAASSPSQNGSEQGGLTAQAAEQTIREVYSTAADGEYDTSYGLLSQNFKATTAPTQPEWSGQFDTLESIRFVRGPDAKVSGNTATVTGVTVAEKASRTERNTVTWRMVNEGAEWKLDGIPSFQQDIISG